MIELASFTPFSEIILQFLDQLTETIGVVLADDHRERPDRGAAPAVPVPVAGATGAVGGAPAPADGAAGDERGAPGEGGAARAPEPRHRDQEPRDRDGPQLARGEGGAARAQLEVQVRVPGEHVARAAHAAQLAADPVQGARRQRERQPHREAGGRVDDDPQRGLRPARADQRHPRPVQGRGREDGRARRPHGAAVGARLRRALVRARRGREGARLRDRPGARRARADPDRRAAAPAGAEEPALERVQVHRQRARSGWRSAARPRTPTSGRTRWRARRASWRSP